ncbi:phospholipase A [Rheinheimera muenzenbergensis]|uniref:Phospholipase A n=1 Tax=Rheinheimera muenzenbergensis TaxID=1193628 RepID=A0ABU8C1H5_9GAMM
MKFNFILLLFFSNCVFGGMQSIEVIEKNKREKSNESNKELISKFAQWGDNEVLARYTDVTGTRRHVDVSLGFRYLMTNTPLPKGDKSEYAVAIAYQGEFDFFALTRNSSPVVTTRHNPSIFYTKVWDPDKLGLSSWVLSFEHESNGQVTDTQARLDAVIEGFQKDYENDLSVSDSELLEMAQQTISRSNNFLGFGINYQIGKDKEKDKYKSDCLVLFDCIHIFGKIRYQLDKDPEDNLWWQEGQSDKLKDYVGTEIDVSSPFYLWNLKSSLRLTYRTGQLLGASPFKNHTFDLRYYIDLPIGRALAKVFEWDNAELFALPVVLRYHSGYLDELYNYSQRVNYVAVGLHARY